MTINRRKMLIGLGILPLVTVAVIARPNDGNLIKVSWDTYTRKDGVTTTTAILWINGVYVGHQRAAWSGGDVEKMDERLTALCEYFKNKVFLLLRTHEYDPVIDNSTSDFYLE